MDNTENNTKPGEKTAAEPLSTPGNMSGLNNELDIDDAVHFSAPKPSEANKQQDGDDAVHKNYKPAAESSNENEEKDPDDAIHGNG